MKKNVNNGMCKLKKLRRLQEQMGVKFIDVDVLAFQKKVKGVQESILKDNAQAKPIYDHIQKVNKKYEGKDGE